MDLVRIQFRFSQSDLLQLNKMVETAVERIYRSSPEERFPAFTIKPQYPILLADRPDFNLSANLILKLQVYLHKHVVDSKTSFLYLTAVCLDTAKHFQNSRHGLNILQQFTFMDGTRSFLPFEQGEGVLTVPTLPDANPKYGLVSEAIFMMQIDTLQYATPPFDIYREVIASQGKISFGPIKESYDDRIILTLADLQIDKVTLELNKQGVQWDDSDSFRSKPDLPTVQSARSNVQAPPSTAATTASTIASVVPSAVSQVSSLAVTSASTLGPHAFGVPSSSFPYSGQNNLNVRRVEILPLPAFTPQPLAQQFPNLTWRQRQAARDGIQYDRPIPPANEKAVPRLNNPYHQSVTNDVRERLSQQVNDSRPILEKLQVDLTKDVSPLAISNENCTVVKETLQDILGPQPKPLNISACLNVDLPPDSSVPSMVDTSKDISRTPDISTNSTSGSYNSANDLTVVAAPASPPSPAPLALPPSSRTTRSGTTVLRDQWKSIILQHCREPKDIGLVKVNPNDDNTPKTLFVLPERLVKFGTLLAGFMTIASNKEHWYFVQVLDPLFFQGVDDIWRFRVNPAHSANFLNCQALDSAYIVLHERQLPNDQLALLARLFTKYETRTDS